MIAIVGRIVEAILDLILPWFNPIPNPYQEA
ncbi:hypothetical protein SEA_CLOWN_13 [Gordonia phage Clown]|uniref:Uncharacterized protein n=1 Tax=Gordonia phage Clown TaxID=2759393 RepID=A0A7L7SID1_9CAUD|nr:hypothetical protein KNV25_gp13 [Gordonia phage Clown]QOC56011.1 hypothetical protein SEA_CLOWN_13 [Gordonia phage Clown]